MASMFGIIVSGRLVQTNLTSVTETKFVSEVADADNVNHIVVFMTGTTAFPDGFGAAVHFCWPETGWTLLGFLTNDKPSAIFRITAFKAGVATENVFSAHSTHTAQVGISVEPLNELAQQTPASNAQPSTVSSFTQFTQKLLENFINYASSFAVSQSQMTPQPNETFVPSKAIQSWYNNIEKKMESNPNWWKG